MFVLKKYILNLSSEVVFGHIFQTDYRTEFSKPRCKTDNFGAPHNLTLSETSINPHPWFDILEPGSATEFDQSITAWQLVKNVDMKITSQSRIWLICQQNMNFQWLWQIL